MIEAVESRLKKRVQLLQPSLNSAGCALTLAACSTLHTILLAYLPQMAEKVQDFLLFFSDNTDKETLYNTKLYHLTFTLEPTTEEKARLWKTLQAM